MAGINLVIKDIKPKPAVSAFAKTLKKIVLITLLFFVVGVSVVVAVFIFYSRKTKLAKDNQQVLMNQIKALEGTEQKLILVKDRIEKIQLISKKENASDAFGMFETITNTLPQEVVIGEVVLDAKSAEVQVLADSLNNLSKFMSQSVVQVDAGKVVLNSLYYSSKTGYGASISFFK